ncbi:hypothetical protein BSKO_04130 [Bryopsis sp. KO-2023]|nr:hypothetical protein BSKO_04130 [Bryopsis sp. KO-2023]
MSSAAMEAMEASQSKTGQLVESASGNHQLALPQDNTSNGEEGKDPADSPTNGDEHRPSAGKKLSSRFRGVCWNKKNKRWQAAINSAGKYLYLGSYLSEDDAAKAFDGAAIRIRGRKARINFKFDDYLEDLEVYKRSQQANYSDGVGQGDRQPIGPTITTNVHMCYPPEHHAQHHQYDQGGRYKQERYDQAQFEQHQHQHQPPPHRPGRFNGYEPVVHHSSNADREVRVVPIMNGVPLERDASGVGNEAEALASMRSEALLGRVVRSNVRPNHDARRPNGNCQWENHRQPCYNDPSPPQHQQGQRLRHPFAGSNSYRSMKDNTPIVVVPQDHRGQLMHQQRDPQDLQLTSQPVHPHREWRNRHSQQSQHTPQPQPQPQPPQQHQPQPQPQHHPHPQSQPQEVWIDSQDIQGQMNPTSYPPQAQQVPRVEPREEIQNDPMSTIPKDCQIVKIIPNACGVFAVLYARTGHPSTGAVIWDGREVHSMGMFTSGMDAHQACMAASAMAVKLIQNGSGGGGNSAPPNFAPFAEHGQGNGHCTPVVEPQVEMEAINPPTSNPPKQNPEQEKVREPVRKVVHENPERRAPQSSPFVSFNADSLIQVVSIPSKDVEGLLTSQLPATEAAETSSKSSGQGGSTQAVAELVSENKGNLGSLLHYDSWSSSILGLISVSVPRGANGQEENGGGMDKDGKNMSLGDLPSNMGSLTDLGGKPFVNTSSQSDPKQDGSDYSRVVLERSDQGRERSPIQSSSPGHDGPGSSPKSAPSLFGPKKNEMASSLSLVRGEDENGNGIGSGNGNYNDVLELIVCRDRPNRRKPGNLAPSRAHGDTLDSQEEGNGEWPGVMKRKIMEEAASGMEENRRKRARTPERSSVGM